MNKRKILIHLALLVIITICELMTIYLITPDPKSVAHTIDLISQRGPFAVGALVVLSLCFYPQMVVYRMATRKEGPMTLCLSLVTDRRGIKQVRARDTASPRQRLDERLQFFATLEIAEIGFRSGVEVNALLAQAFGALATSDEGFTSSQKRVIAEAVPQLKLVP